MFKRGLDRVLGKGNWGAPKWGPGNYPKLPMSYFERTGWLPRGTTTGKSWEQAMNLNPDGLAFIDAVEGEEWEVTFDEADRLMKNLALELINMGIRSGDRVATALPNSVRYALSILAINYIGAVWVPLHVFQREAEWSYIIKHAGVKTVICDDMNRGYSLAKLADKMASRYDFLQNVIVSGESEPGQMNFKALIEKDQSEKQTGDYIKDVFLKENIFTSDDIMEIIYTSGTTGSPKGVMHTHDSNLYHALCWIYHYDLGCEDSLFNLAIMSHQHGFSVLWQPFYISGLPQYFIGEFDPVNALKVIDRYKPTIVGLSPPIITVLANHPEIENIDTSSVRGFVSAGAPLPLTSATMIKQKIKNRYFSIVNGYGLSECNGECGTPMGDFSSAKKASESVGLCHIGCQIKVTETGSRNKIVPVGQEGEIAARGPLAGVGYYNNPEKTHKNWDTKGWVYSGDLGKMDQNGNVYITGRAKDIIVRGGNVVQPLFIEEYIRQYPGVADVSVIAIPDDKMVETACAVIVPKKRGKKFTRQEIYNFMKDKTMRDNIPDRVETWNELIYTATGKQVKYRIKEKVLGNIEKEKTATAD